MARIAVLDVRWKPVNNKVIQTVSVVLMSADPNQSKAAKLKFIKKKGWHVSVYVVHAPAECELAWKIEGDTGGAVELEVMDGQRKCVALDTVQTEIIDGEPSYGFVKFRVKP